MNNIEDYVQFFTCVDVQYERVQCAWTNKEKNLRRLVCSPVMLTWVVQGNVLTPLPLVNTLPVMFLVQNFVHPGSKD